MELTRTFKIPNELGLHARAAGKIVELGHGFCSKLFLSKDGHDQEVDGSSILSILTLACPKGTGINARIVGEDAEEFMEALNDLLEQKFGEKK